MTKCGKLLGPKALVDPKHVVRTLVVICRRRGAFKSATDIMNEYLHHSVILVLRAWKFQTLACAPRADGGRVLNKFEGGGGVWMEFVAFTGGGWSWMLSTRCAKILWAVCAMSCRLIAANFGEMYSGPFRVDLPLPQLQGEQCCFVRAGPMPRF